MRNRVEDRSKFINFVNRIKIKEGANNLDTEIASLNIEDKTSLIMGAVETISLFKEENLGTPKAVTTLRSISKVLSELCKSYELSFNDGLINNNVDIDDETCIKSPKGMRLSYRDICLQLIGEYRMKDNKVIRIKKRRQQFTEFNIYEFIYKGDSKLSRELGEVLCESGFLKRKVCVTSLSREDRAEILVSLLKLYSGCYFTLDKVLSIILSGCDSEVLRNDVGQYFNIVEMIKDILKKVALDEFGEVLTLDLTQVNKTFLINHTLMK